MKTRIITIIVIGIICSLIAINLESEADLAQRLEKISASRLTYYPADEWQRLTPEQVGLDSTELAALRATIVNNNLGVDSITIVRYGYLCYEEYFDYYNYSNIHSMFSVTKSVVSILVGIANRTGYITDLDEPIVDIFPEKTFQNLDARKQAITIRHLLRMQSGLAWDEWNVSYLTTLPKNDFTLLSNTSDETYSQWPTNSENAYWAAFLHPDPVQYSLDLPMATDPGTEFVYNSASSHLLSVILTRKTGMNVSDFAEEHLFSPLGISEYVWFKDANGINRGGTGLWLRPLDMAKIGYLYANQGQWRETPIVTAQYAEESWDTYTIPYANYEYGYLWWRYNLQDLSYIYADGLLGQLIAVVPEKDLVVTMTCSDDTSYTLINTRVMTLTMNDVTIIDNTTTTISTEEETTTTTESSEMQPPSSTSSDPQTTPWGVLELLLLELSLGVILIHRKRRK